VTGAPASVTPASVQAQPAIDIRGLRFAYARGPAILDIPALTIARGERVFVHGPSGSGKTTLLGVLAGVLRATEGQVQVLGSDLATMGGAARDAFRALHVGYVFQLFNLIPYLTVLENIVLPCRLDARRRQRLGATSLDAAGRAMARALDIGELVGEPVTSLSVGQQQRVAAARALIGAPELVIADEPTSALDSDRREQFLELLFRSCADAGATLVFVSHDRQLMPLFDRGVSLPEVNRAAPRMMAGVRA
jgi:putative ABC transport system ATP-binding protein